VVRERRLRPEGEADREVAVTGEVGRVRVNVTPRWPMQSPDNLEEAADRDRELVLLLTEPETREGLQSEIERAVKQAFGDEGFYAQPYVVSRGRSVEILVVISAIYTAILKFNEIVDALTKAAENIRTLIEFFARHTGRFSDSIVGLSSEFGRGVVPLSGVGGIATLRLRTLIWPAIGSLLYLAALCLIAVLTFHGFNLGS